MVHIYTSGFRNILPTSLSGKTQWHKEHGCAKWFFCHLWLLLVKIVWYDASEILGKSPSRLYDINCLLCQTTHHLTFFKLRLSHDWQHWLDILTALFWHLNWNGAAQTQESPCANGSIAFPGKQISQSVWILSCVWLKKEQSEPEIGITSEMWRRC